jgi:hypothetical protein
MPERTLRVNISRGKLRVGRVHGKRLNIAAVNKTNAKLRLRDSCSKAYDDPRPDMPETCKTPETQNIYEFGAREITNTPNDQTTETHNDGTEEKHNARNTLCCVRVCCVSVAL